MAFQEKVLTNILSSLFSSEKIEALVNKLLVQDYPENKQLDVDFVSQEGTTL